MAGPDHLNQPDRRMPPDEERRLIKAQIKFLSENADQLGARVESNEKAIALLVETSVAQGIRTAVADERTWDAFFAALAKRAKDQTGEVAFSGLRWLGSRLFWGLVIGGILYFVGGWALLVATVKGAVGK